MMIMHRFVCINSRRSGDFQTPSRPDFEEISTVANVSNEISSFEMSAANNIFKRVYFTLRFSSLFDEFNPFRSDAFFSWKGMNTLFKVSLSILTFSVRDDPEVC